MATSSPLKAILFLGGAAGAALGTAYLAGVFDPQQQPAAIAQPATPPVNAASEVPAAAKPDAAAPAAAEANAPVAGQDAAAPATGQDATAPAAGQDAAAPAAGQQVAAAQPEKPVVAGEAPTPVAPSFDLLRVEPDGSMVIAGKAMAGSSIEALVGSRVIGKAETTPGGDFVIILDQPLQPGDYQVVLRSTGPGSVVVSSAETAVVSVPSSPDGQVLALVEQAGAPSKLITVTPEATPAAGQAAPAAAAPAVAPTANVAVEAVEIDGRKVFVAGSAPPGSKLRGYANEILLGDATATPEGRFLIETERNLPVGDYIVRVDQLSADGVKVLSRATVPFKREAGEAVAAVAPAQPDTPAPAATEAPAAAETPAAPATAETPVTAGEAAPAQAAPAEAVAPATEAAAASDPAVEAATAPQLEASAAGVIIRRGDTLWRISKRVYGRGTRYSTIYTANRKQIADPDRIWPGQVFRVPDKSDEGEAADMNAVEGQATKIQ